MDDVPAPRKEGSSSGEDPERAVRFHVHVALASIILTFAAPLVSWMLWLDDRRKRAGVWTRRLLAIAILDTFLVLGLALSAAFGDKAEHVTEGPPRIGVVLDVSQQDGKPGARVDHTVPDSPAAAAGIAPGDRILAVDGKPIERADQLTTEISATKKDHARRLDVLRDGAHREIDVTPTTKRLPVQRRSSSMFAPSESEAESQLGRTANRSFAWAAGLLELALVGALAFKARMKRAPLAPGLLVLAGLIALPLASTITLAFFVATIGASLGALLVSILSGSLALLLVGLIARTTTRHFAVQVGVTISAPKAIALGVLYGVTGAARVAILLSLAVTAFGLPLRTAAEAFGLDASWSPPAIGLFVVTTVVIAPIAEELMFRGVLLPWAARWMRPAAALAWTTVIFAAGHSYYGVGVILIAYYGLVLGWARLRTGGLVAPITLHALLNGVTALALLATRD